MTEREIHSDPFLAPGTSSLNTSDRDLTSAPDTIPEQPPLKFLGLSIPRKNLSYLGDWLTAIIMLAISMPIQNLEPFNRPFSPTDPTLSHPHLPDIVPSWAAILISLTIPPVILCIFHVIHTYARREGSLSSVWQHHPGRPSAARLLLHDLHLMLLGLALSFATAKLATDILKMWAGRLRPDFLSRCRWSSEENRCTGDVALIIEGRRSFPSGHSSNAFAGFGFLSLWIAGHLGVLSGWGGAYGGGRAWRVILAGMPLFPAAYVAISRTQQYIHNPSDVAFGSALGFGCAVIFFFMYYRMEGVPRDDTPPSVAFGKKDKLEDAPFETVDRLKGPGAVAAGGYEEV